MTQFFADTVNVKPLIMPIVQYPDGHFETDSTPIIVALDKLAEPQRSVFPIDPVLNFLNLLIEDFADEWLVKSIFHYRFTYTADRAFGPRWVMDDAFPGIGQAELDNKTAAFLIRQTDRMPIVGCTPENAALIESSYEEVLAILEPYVALERFLFGGTPSLADFGLFGVLKTLATDPTPQEIMRTKAPRVDNWVRRLDDLSGVEGTFRKTTEIDQPVNKLVALINELYLPYLRANAHAFANGEPEFTVSLRGTSYRQATFKYQVKCLASLRAAYDNLSSSQRGEMFERFNINLSN
ncbi:MAG: glutathione S-transferase C-terminal domain-containing protein [Gammaproteobacteria bacterium]